MADHIISNRASAELIAPASISPSIPARSAKTPYIPAILVAKSSEEKSSVNVSEERQKLATQSTPVEGLKEVFQEDSKSLDKTISKLNDSLQNIQRNLEFSIDNDSGKIVINVTDKETDKVVRQIPSEEVLELARNLQDLSTLQSNQSIDEQSGHTLAEGVFFKGSV